MEQTVSCSIHHLVATIEQARARLLAPTVRHALLQVPRHRFIDHYYEGKQVRASPPQEAGEAWQAWLSAVYRDQALTTHIDARGLPTSSSSQPSVMAALLEALSIEAGQRVLEIGTGTGYNAALLAALTGDPRLVTTLDIDPALVQTARSRIEQVVGAGMTVLSGDGRQGAMARAPYDRIIATGSWLPVPWAWIEQLAVGGRLIMDVRGRIGGGILLLHKQSTEQTTGTFLTEMPAVAFMRLRSTLDELAVPGVPKGHEHFLLQEEVFLDQDAPASACAWHFCSYEQFRGPDDALNLWVQWSFPDLSISWKRTARSTSAILTEHTSQTVAILEPQGDQVKVTVRGRRPLWSELVSAYQDWLRAGKPGYESYTLSLDSVGRQVMLMQHQGHDAAFLLSPETRRASDGGATCFSLNEH